VPHNVGNVEGAKTAGGHTCLARLGEAGVDAFTIMKLAGY